ncbi:hypothetical protein J6590_067317 [Homalodisca vitripennis]|nr:hypothetical protein J6590_067317 [Homalodisca vitripennis]
MEFVLLLKGLAGITGATSVFLPWEKGLYLFPVISQNVRELDHPLMVRLENVLTIKEALPSLTSILGCKPDSYTRYFKSNISTFEVSDEPLPQVHMVV